MGIRLHITYGLIIVALILASCGPSNRLRRAEKLIKKAEILGAQWHTDTLWRELSLFTPEVAADTIFVIQPGDTVVLEKERLKTIIRRLAGDTIFVSSECQADTIQVEVPVTVVKTIEARGWLRWWHLLIALIVGVVLGRLILKLLI